MSLRERLRFLSLNLSSLKYAAMHHRRRRRVFVLLTDMRRDADRRILRIQNEHESHYYSFD
jgi:hypothetical protein